MNQRGNELTPVFCQRPPGQGQSGTVRGGAPSLFPTDPAPHPFRPGQGTKSSTGWGCGRFIEESGGDVPSKTSEHRDRSSSIEAAVDLVSQGRSPSEGRRRPGKGPAIIKNQPGDLSREGPIFTAGRRTITRVGLAIAVTVFSASRGIGNQQSPVPGVVQNGQAACRVERATGRLIEA